MYLSSLYNHFSHHFHGQLHFSKSLLFFTFPSPIPSPLSPPPKYISTKEWIWNTTKSLQLSIPIKKPTKITKTSLQLRPSLKRSKIHHTSYLFFQALDLGLLSLSRPDLFAKSPQMNPSSRWYPSRRANFEKSSFSGGTFTFEINQKSSFSHLIPPWPLTIIILNLHLQPSLHETTWFNTSCTLPKQKTPPPLMETSWRSLRNKIQNIFIYFIH